MWGEDAPFATQGHVHELVSARRDAVDLIVAAHDAHGVAAGHGSLERGVVRAGQVIGRALGIEGVARVSTPCFEGVWAQTHTAANVREAGCASRAATHMHPSASASQLPGGIEDLAPAAVLLCMRCHLGDDTRVDYRALSSWKRRPWPRSLRTHAIHYRVLAWHLLRAPPPRIAGANTHEHARP